MVFYHYHKFYYLNLQGSMNQYNIEKIKDELYFQKLGAILQSIRQWQRKHDILLQDQYIQPISDIIFEANKDCQEVKHQCHSLHEIMESQKQFLSSLKSDKNKSSKPDFLKMDQITSTPIFSKMYNSFLNKRESLLQLKSFIITFNSSISSEQLVLKKLFHNLQAGLKQLKVQAKQLEKFESDKFNKISIKKGRKQFDIAKIQEIQAHYIQFLKKCSEIYSSVLKIRTQMKTHIQRIYNSISKNFNHYRIVYQSTFGEDIGSEVQEYFAKKLKDSQKHISDQGSCLQLEFKHKTSQHQFTQELIKDFKKLSNEAVEQITIRSWDMRLKETREQDKSVKGCWTLDHKLVLINKKDNNIFKVIDLQETKLSEEQQKFENTIVIKPKKKSTSFYLLQFVEPERKDEFTLHYQKMKGEI